MSESGEKSFDAPPSRIAKARREGNLPRAQEFGANLAFIFAALATIAIAAPFGALARAALVRAATEDSALSLGLAVVALGLVPMFVAALSGLGGGIVQNGGLVLVAPSLKFERLQPAEGIKRMLSREAATHGARAAVAFTLASVAMLPTLSAPTNTTANGPNSPSNNVSTRSLRANRRGTRCAVTSFTLNRRPGTYTVSSKRPLAGM